MYITASLCLLITAIIIYFTNKYYQYKKALKSIPGSEDVSLSTNDANFRSKLTKLIDGHREDGVFKLKINNEINVIISTKELIRDFLCPSNSKSVQKEARTDCPFKSSLICLQDSEEWKNMRRLLTCSFLFRSVYDLNNQLNFISRKVINTFSNNNNYIHEYNDGGNDISCPAIKMREMVTAIVLDTIFETFLCYKLSGSEKRNDMINLFVNDVASLKTCNLFDDNKKLDNETNRGLESLNEVISDAFESRKELLTRNNNNCGSLSLSLNRDNDGGDKNESSSYGFTLIDCLIRQHLSGNFTSTETSKEQKKRDAVNVDKKKKKEMLLSKECILNELAAVIVAGVEPVSKLLTNILLHLANEPSAMERMRTEIDEECKKMGNASDVSNVQANNRKKGGNEDVSWRSIKQTDRKIRIMNSVRLIDYLISEVMTIHPPVEFVSRKVVKETVSLLLPSGVPCNIPTGVNVTVCLSFRDDVGCGMKDEDGGGKIGNGTKGLPRLNLDKRRAKDIPFSFGSGIRSCIGQKFAIQLLKIFLIEFVTNFDLNLDPKDNNQTDNLRIETLQDSNCNHSDLQSVQTNSPFQSNLLIKRRRQLVDA